MVFKDTEKLKKYLNDIRSRFREIYLSSETYTQMVSYKQHTQHQPPGTDVEYLNGAAQRDPVTYSIKQVLRF